MLRLLVVTAVVMASVGSCARPQRGGSGDLLLRGPRRRLLQGPVVTVDVNQTSALPGFDTNKMGGYRSEETDYWWNIYDPEHTLGPLQMATNRVQISLTDTELGPDGSFIDPLGTQMGIIQKIAESVSEDIFITVGFPWTNYSQGVIAAGFPEGWQKYWAQTFVTLSDRLATDPRYATPGKTVWIEMLGEPDLPTWSFVYGTNRALIWSTVKMIYDAFNRYPGKFKLGGCGFALPNSEWVHSFVDWQLATGMQFQFYSYHSYLGWTDSTDPAHYPFPGHPRQLPNLHTEHAKFKNFLASRGLSGVPIFISEYAWQDGDLAASAGFVDEERSGRQTMAGHENCARTLQSIDLIVQEPTIARAYWAQGVGTDETPEHNATQLYLYAYDPFVVFKQETKEYRYKSSYYAFYWYGQLAGTTRLEVASADPALGVWAGRAGRTLTLVLWNRSMQPRSAALSLPAVPGWWPCLLHRVDDLSFTVQAPGLEAIIAGPTSRLPPVEAGVTTVAQALAYFAANPLRPEASAALTIWMSSNVEGLQLE